MLSRLAAINVVMSSARGQVATVSQRTVMTPSLRMNAVQQPQRLQARYQSNDATGAASSSTPCASCGRTGKEGTPSNWQLTLACTPGVLIASWLDMRTG